MTDHTELIARLRKDDLFWEAPITCRSEAADALEAAQAENAQWRVDFKEMLIERDAALARLAELEKQEPVGFVESAVRGAGGFHACLRQGVFVPAGANLYAAAGAPPVQPVQGLQSVADALTIEQLNDKVARLMAVQPSQAQAALDAIIWYYENCTGSDSSISAFRQMVDRVVKMKPNFCESCAMDIATCDCVTPRPATVTVQPSQAGEVSKQDIYDIAHRKATRYVCTAAPSDVMYGFSEMHLLDFVAAINAKESGK